jgi:hypothetical protein
MVRLADTPLNPASLPLYDIDALEEGPPIPCYDIDEILATLTLEDEPPACLSALFCGLIGTEICLGPCTPLTPPPPYPELPGPVTPPRCPRDNVATRSSPRIVSGSTLYLFSSPRHDGYTTEWSLPPFFHH